MAPIDFLFDYASPFAYLATELLPRRLAGADLRFVPIYLRGLETFAKGLPYNANKLRYVSMDLQRCADHEGIPLRVPPVFPINGLASVRGALAAQELGGFPAYHTAMFHAAWRDGRNIGDKAVVLAIAAEAGLDRDRFAALVETPETKDRLKTATAAAEARGAFGVPTFFVGEQMFWGHDRMDFVARAAGLAV
jgi:2-hydroxychromene-2-carboxylate isomerase